MLAFPNATKDSDHKDYSDYQRIFYERFYARNKDNNLILFVNLQIFSSLTVTRY